MLNDSVKTFSGMTNVIAKAPKIVTHFHHSAQAQHRLLEKQQSLKVPEHKLKTYSPTTRWNWLYLMIDRLVEQGEPLTVINKSC